ncbi:MAG: S8/S53 family peptidase, partial [Bacteroidales bacterium]
ESNSYNGRPEVRLRLKKPVGNKYTFALFVTAESGDFHAWNLAELTNDVGNWGGDFYAPTLFPEWANGDPQYGIGTPANVDCAISIAAHHSRYQTPSGNWTGGQIANFSSYGPTIDGRQKPEISAPGNNVISALSSYTTTYSGMFSKTVTFNDRSYRFVPLSGTSMSSPFVAGVVALILQANPYLSSAQVKEILITTAYQDSFTEQVGPERFGYGKINAYQAVFKALHTVGVEDHSIAESKYTLFPIPAQHILYVTIESNDPHITSEIFDISGKLVTKQNLKPGVNQINIQTYPTGCYFIKITDKKNVTMKKLIKN